jgi:hypothetical protein
MARWKKPTKEEILKNRSLKSRPARQIQRLRHLIKSGGCSGSLSVLCQKRQTPLAFRNLARQSRLDLTGGDPGVCSQALGRYSVKANTNLASAHQPPHPLLLLYRKNCIILNFIPQNANHLLTVPRAPLRCLRMRAAATSFSPCSRRSRISRCSLHVTATRPDPCCQL